MKYIKIQDKRINFSQVVSYRKVQLHTKEFAIQIVFNCGEKHYITFKNENEIDKTLVFVDYQLSIIECV